MNNRGVIMDFTGMSDRGILKEIGRRVKGTRLRRNLTQQRLATSAGVTRSTVSQIEGGSPSNMLTFVQVLRALGVLDELDSLLPDPGISPLEIARMKGRMRKRASGRRGGGKKDGAE
jgi:transcriptional regulator with XRE-family HTH domain